MSAEHSAAGRQEAGGAKLRLGDLRHLLRQIAGYFSHWWLYIKALVKWFGVSYITGMACGMLGSAFHIGVEKATEFRGEHPWMLFLLPVLGLVIVLIYKVARVEGQGTDKILEEVQTGNGLSLALVPAIFFSTILTHLGGGSAGREGAALQMGGAIGYHTGRILRLDDKDLRTATMTGMAAFFSALFGTPLAATVFAMGVISIGLIYHAAFIPCLISALIAYGVSRRFGIAPTRFSVVAPGLSGMMLLRVAVLGILCALVSALFCYVLHGFEHRMARVFRNPWIRVVAGGIGVVGLTILVGSGDYNGAGMDVITRAVEQGEAVPYAFLLKMLFTALTLSAGFKGGEVVPSFFIGAVFGCAAGPLLGIPAGFAASIGLVSVFCGAVNCPLASIFLALELFGSSSGLLYYAIACGLSYVLSGYNGLYSHQRILYSKLKAQYIDVYTNAHHAGDVTRAEKEHQ